MAQKNRKVYRGGKVEKKQLKMKCGKLVNAGRKEMSRNRKLIHRINRMKRRLRKYLDQATFTDIDYKGYRVTFVNMPTAKMSETFAEAKAMIDEIDKIRKERND